MRLHLACGKDVRDGYVNIDAHVEAPGVVNLDAAKLPFRDGAADEVLCVHGLEHVPFRQTLPLLREWLRVLRPGGACVIEVPDAEWCVRRWLEAPDPDEWQETDWSEAHRWGFHTMALWGNQEHPGEFHVTAFTGKRLRAALRAAGFGDVTLREVFSHGVQSIEARAIKPAP